VGISLVSGMIVVDLGLHCMGALLRHEWDATERDTPQLTCSTIQTQTHSSVRYKHEVRACVGSWRCSDAASSSARIQT
jgi:hypothetical protein